MITLSFYSKNLKNLKLISRCFSSASQQIRSFRYNEQKFLDKDNIPNGYSLIYRAPMKNYIVIAKNVSSLTVGLMTSLIAYNFNIINIENQEQLVEVGLVSSEEDLIYFVIGFILINLAIRLVILYYPLRIYKNIDKYIATFEGQLPFKKRKIEFKKGEVTEAKSMILNPFNNAMYNLNNTKSLLLVQFFKTPSELYQMMKK